MLGKLIKYEFKASGRIFFPIYICILVLAVINGLFNNYDIFSLEESGFSFSIENIQGLLMLVLFALFVSLFVLTIVLTIQRFKKNLLEDEGYLMFTLPVGTKSLILSKFIVALIFSILSAIVAMSTFVLIGVISARVNLSDVVSLLRGDVFAELISITELWKVILSIVTMLILSYSTFILTVYLSISVGQLPIFNKHRVSAGVIAFFVINTVVSVIQNFISKLIVNDTVSKQVTENLSIFVADYDLWLIIFNVIVIVIIFMVTEWILNKKLNLE